MRLWQKITAFVGALIVSAAVSHADMMDGVPGTTRSFLPPITYTTGTPSIGMLDCFRVVQLGGNAQLTLTVGSSLPLPWCQLKIINIDVYTGVGTGRGKLISSTLLPCNFFLYPGQSIEIFAGGGSLPSLGCPFGIPWTPTVSPVFIFGTVGTGGSDTLNDGLATGSGAFATPQHCSDAAYGQIYFHGTIYCEGTAGQTFSPASVVTSFGALSNGALLWWKSTTNGTQFTWNCPSGLFCWQGGDQFVGEMQDISFVATATSPSIIAGHQQLILDFVSNVTMTGASSSTDAIGCDTDSHFNVVGVTWAGTLRTAFNACANSMYHLSGVQTGSGTWGRFFLAFTLSKIFLDGNVSYAGSPTTSPGLLQGGSIFSSGTGNVPFGGAPTTGTGGGINCPTGC